MVYSYRDNDDLVIVVRDIDKALKDSKVTSLLQELLLTGALGDKVEIPDASLLPQEVEITSDEEFKAVASDFRAGRFNGELRADVCAKLNDWIEKHFRKTGKEMEEYISFISEEEMNRFLINYDSIISADKKEWITSISSVSSYEQFLLKGTEEEKKQLIRSVLKRFVS